jgi:hypothetical protein
MTESISGVGWGGSFFGGLGKASGYGCGSSLLMLDRVWFDGGVMLVVGWSCEVVCRWCYFRYPRTSGGPLLGGLNDSGWLVLVRGGIWLDRLLIFRVDLCRRQAGHDHVEWVSMSTCASL